MSKDQMAARIPISHSISDIETYRPAVHHRFPSQAEFRASRLAPNRHLCQMSFHDFLQYQILTQVLGAGTFGQVYAGIHTGTRERVAIKIIYKGRLSGRDQRMLTRECAVLAYLDHPNIISVHGGYETPEAMYWILPLMAGGTLMSYLEQRGRLNEVEVRGICQQLVEAVSYCHARNIIHRDIKLDNLLLQRVCPCVPDGARHARVILSDFGFATMQSEDGPGLKTHPGSLEYASPELLRRQPYYGRPVDIWAIGVCLFYLTQGAPPFRASTADSLYLEIQWSPYRLEVDVGPEFSKLMAGLLQKNPLLRMRMGELEVHPWLVKLYLQND